MPGPGKKKRQIRCTERRKAWPRLRCRLNRLGGLASRNPCLLLQPPVDNVWGENEGVWESKSRCYSVRWRGCAWSRRWIMERLVKGFMGRTQALFPKLSVAAVVIVWSRPFVRRGLFAVYALLFVLSVCRCISHPRWRSTVCQCLPTWCSLRDY